MEENFSIPKHKKLTKDEVNALLSKYILEDVSKLPKIKKKDLALSQLNAEVNDVIEIDRESFAGKSKYYRVVVE